MLLLSLILWGLAAVLEWTAVVAFVRGDVFTALEFHGLAALVQTLAAWCMMPVRYRKPVVWALAWLLGVSACIPVLSWFGLLLAFLPGLYWPRDHELTDWEEQPALDLPYQAIAVDSRAVQRRGGLAAVLLRDETQWRVRAVMATRYLGDRHAVPVLRLALKDSVDEVRLLAYSLLSAKERRIDTAIQDLGDESVDMPARLHMDAGCRDEQIAGLYLEQAELGLAEGAVHRYALEQARQRIEAALAGAPTAQRQFLHGRICLREGRYAEADLALQQAEQLGFDVGKVAPYRAECAFEQGELADVREQLSRLGPQARKAPVLASLVEYWL